MAPRLAGDSVGIEFASEFDWYDSLELAEQALDEHHARASKDEAAGVFAEASFDEDGAAFALLIGLGRVWSVAYFQRNDREPPYYAWRGVPLAGVDYPEDEQMFIFHGVDCYGGSDNFIPTALARRAMTEFLSTGEMPTCLEFVVEE